MGSDVAEAQIDGLSDAEVSVLLEIYEVLRLAPDNGRKLIQTGNMYVWDYKGISVTYVLLDPQREVAVLRVDRFPVLSVLEGICYRRYAGGKVHQVVSSTLAPVALVIGPVPPG
jgi:hypothetical protein